MKTAILGLAALALLPACDDGAPAGHTETAADSGTGSPVDSDGDGYDMSVDCDDDDPAIFPGAKELCNGTDDDCDGTVDEDDATDAASWYADTDTDGYGDETATRTGCTQPPGYVTEAGDCDDGNATIHPGGKEICNASDDDCDGAVDEDLPTSTWYEDADGDGYGDASATLASCYAPSGYVADLTDCDDSRADTFPGGTEVCEDGVDQDCNGHDADCRYTGTTSLGDSRIVELVGEDEDDGAGRAVSGAGDVNGDGFADILVGAPYRHEIGSSAGAAYLVLGPVTSELDLSLSAGKFVDYGSGHATGYSVSGAGDMNGDGYADFLVGAPHDGAGMTYLLNGPITGDHDLSSSDIQLEGEDAFDYAGFSVSDAGDVNDDGVPDLLIGAPYNEEAGYDAGAAYLVLGPVTAGRNLALADAKLVAEARGDFAGGSVAGADDVNGDGYADFLVGAEYNDDGGLVAGKAYLLYGPVTGNRDLSLADASFVGEEDLVGWSVSGAGDVNGDGYADIFLGAPDNSEGGMVAGAAYLFYGPATMDVALSSADAKLVGEEASDLAGGSVSDAGDVDGDGFADILVGASRNSGGGAGTGAAYLLYGPITGDRDLSAADAKLTGEDRYGWAGYAVSGAGDTDGDGHADILVGAYAVDDGASDAGAAYLVTFASMTR
jgi:hypothetical protein